MATVKVEKMIQPILTEMQGFEEDFHLPLLVVEDDKGLNRLIQKNLGREGFTVEGAETGKDALTALEHASEFLLLLDLVLPDMTGREILTELRRKNISPPFIVMTGHGDEATAVDMMKLGARDYIVKGSRFIELLPNVIRKVFSELGKEKQLTAMDAALAQAAENWRATFNAIPDFVSVHDLKKRLVRVNKALADHLGMKQEDLIGKKCYEVLHNLAQPWPLCPLETTLQTFQTATQEVDDPNIGLPLQVTCSPMFGKDGNIIGVVHVARDISDQKKAAEEIKRSWDRYREHYDNAPIAYFSISAADGRILQFNNQAMHLFGYNQADLLEMKVFELYVDNSQVRSKAEKIFKLLQNGISVRNEECEMKKKDGTTVWVSVSVDPVSDESGKVTESRSVVIDISERKRLEAALFQAQKMESIGTLAGGIAHDFNNLLNVIIGYGSMMEDSLPDDESRTHLENILTAANRATQLTKGLLTFSRKQVLELMPVNINEITRGLEKMLCRIIGEDVTMSSNLYDKELVVMADRIQIEQILMNLAANSRDAMPNGGTLTVTTRPVEFKTGNIEMKGYPINPGRYAQISVADSGLGMDDETKERIFDPFFTTKEVGKGTGLGMAIVYGIVKQHEGYIDCYSEPGRGTTFKIYLPLATQTVFSGKNATAEPPSGGIETILVAEDDPMLRKLTLKLLKNHGYNVMEAVDGQDVIDRFKENIDQIDMIILDVIMPKKNGSEAYLEISRLKPDIKALFVSGYPSERVYQMGMLQEGVNFLYKPVMSDTLLRKIREIINHPSGMERDNGKE